MTRDDIKQEVLALNGNNILLELPTGTGKSKIALDKLKALYSKTKHKKTLIVVPRNVHKINWSNEVKKWWSKCPLDITYTTYVSLPKYTGNWDYVLFDEVHHLSERCRKSLCDFNIKYSILLSATVNDTLKDEFKEVFSNLQIYKKNLRNVIDSEILPDPKVYLYPLRLDNISQSECIIKNPKAKGKLLECTYHNRWEYLKKKNNPIKIHCTEFQYYNDLSNQIDYWKNRYNRTRNDIAKNKWLRLCSDRLKWLSDKKIRHLFSILNHLSRYRTLTFCNSIEQTELLGEYCINSKNSDSLRHLYDFNNGKINHITACNMLNESMNLVNCQVGIFANLNSSEIITKQRIGRILRHRNPITVIPFFKNTREEELVEKMLENYNKELVSTISNIEEIKV